MCRKLSAVNEMPLSFSYIKNFKKPIPCATRTSLNALESTQVPSISGALKVLGMSFFQKNMLHVITLLFLCLIHHIICEMGFLKLCWAHHHHSQCSFCGVISSNCQTANLQKGVWNSACSLIGLLSSKPPCFIQSFIQFNIQSIFGDYHNTHNRAGT